MAYDDGKEAAFMLVFGIALLLGAAILTPLAVVAMRRWLRQRAIAEIRPRAVATCAGQPLTVTGVAAPGPEGAIESRLAGADCVWHGHEVLRHYWQWRNREDTGERERVRGCDSIADHGSAEPFGVVPAAVPAARDGLPVLVDPRDAQIEDADMCLQRVVGRPQRGVPAPADDLLARVKGRISGIFRGETIEFEYREWVIRPGDPVLVEGHVELRDGHPVLTAPPGGRLRIRHMAPDAAQEPPRATDALLLSGGAVATACVGLLLTLAGA
ncbi:GIDE domain-containing protein [Marinactinospora rubrisoli]|uniref:RING-type E3 ubiquitin transferase n=1 Tax=Marinactinospora rubrisoli TaxID=2715399 RepID=A0ABW2K8X1_9ACTN